MGIIPRKAIRRIGFLAFRLLASQAHKCEISNKETPPTNDKGDRAYNFSGSSCIIRVRLRLLLPAGFP
jgi:hypothetical protein